MLGGIGQWLSDRLGLEPIHKTVLARRVPRSSWYQGDGATLTLLLGVLIGTGAVMALTYSPAADSAYDSVVYITERQTLGWFVRALHYWSAGLMVVMLYLHLFRQIVSGGYKAPREATWLIGVLLFFAVLVMSFTGYVLRWDERGIYGIKVAIHILHSIPLVGEALALLVQGGSELGGRTLTRVYAVHVLLVPLLILGLVGYHLYLVILHGITTPGETRQPVASAEAQREIYRREKESAEGEVFHPETTAKSGTLALLVFALVVVLALIAGPAELYREANLVERSAPAEEWWWWWYSALSALLPPWLAPHFYAFFPFALFFLLILLPFIDRGPRRGARNRPVAVVAVLAAAIAILVLSDLRRKSPWTGWPQAQPPSVPEGIQLTGHVEQGRQLFARHGCNSCHPIAGQGPQVGTDFGQIRGIWSRAEIRNYILQPPAGVAMPSYRGRLTAEELERVTEFVHTAQTFPLGRGGEK